MPNRLQRKRTKGWRKPEGSVIVDRTSRWGNPFRIQGDMIYGDASHRRTILDPWVFIDGPFNDDDIRGILLEYYRDWLYGDLPGTFYEGNQIVRPRPYSLAEIREALKGKDLLCFCAPDQPCHGDILIEIANSNVLSPYFI